MELTIGDLNHKLSRQQRLIKSPPVMSRQNQQ